MTSKTTTNGKPDPINDSVEKLISLYDQFRQAATESITREPVEIPEMGGLTVYVQTLGGDERDEYEQWIAAERRRAEDEGRDANIRGIRARVAVWCTTDETGKHLFTDADRGWLGQTNSMALDRIFTVADRLSGLTPQAQADIRGNSDGAEVGAAA